MKILLTLLTLGVGLAFITRSERRVTGLLPAPDTDRGEPESWLAAEAEAYTARR